MAEPTVPFDASEMSDCRGCSSKIGWVRKADGIGRGRPHPVQPKGYCGPAVPHGTEGAKVGYTRGGVMLAVLPQEPGTPIVPGWQTIWESHFAFCPKAPIFRQRAKHQEE